MMCVSGLMVVVASVASGMVLATEPTGRTNELDEVIVHGRAGQLQEMRKELESLENRFYARYNELNTVRDFDVHCLREARTGTRLEKRTCRAVYEDKALEAEGQEAFVIRQRLHEQFKAGSPQPMMPGGPPAPPIMAIEARLPQFQQNLKQVVSGNPELLNLLRERAQLADRYKSLQQQVFGAKQKSGEQKPAAPHE